MKATPDASRDAQRAAQRHGATMCYPPRVQSWRERWHEIIFEADTPTGKAFDVGLMILIVASVIAVMLESVRSVRERYGTELRIAEWAFTVVFTIEYVVRLATVRVPSRYVRSFFGVVDLLAVAPTYASLLIEGTQSLIVIRALRLLRVFRVFKLARYLGEADVLTRAVRASRPKITVFLGAVVTLVLIMGTLMYLVEGEEHGFTSIPISVYWAIVTLTTVGYGDIAPQTVLGQALASLVMIAGYSIIAVPTGIIGVEIARASRRVSTQTCRTCSAEGHEADALFCRRCGAPL
jgi:voltage-gated potassium channel